MKILVTGGAGYIGSHTVNLLVKQGYDVSVIDDFSTGSRLALPSAIKVFALDIRNEKDICEICKTESPDAIIHFAGKISVPESFEDPLNYFSINSSGTLSMLHAAAHAQVQCFIFSSTAAVYGDVQQDVVTESAKIAPINPYGTSKAIAEQFIQQTAKKTGLKFALLRYFNVAGASMDGENGQRGTNIGQLIHVASEAALGIRNKLSIYGDDYATPDGTCIRDFIHVEDLASAHIATLKYLVEDKESAIFNVGYGHGSSVRAVVDAMKKISGVNFFTETISRRPGDPACVVSDNTKISTYTDWVPKYDNLETICRSSYEWLQKINPRR